MKQFLLLQFLDILDYCLALRLLNFIGDKLEEEYYITNPSIDISTGIAATILLIAFGAFAGYLPAKESCTNQTN